MMDGSPSRPLPLLTRLLYILVGSVALALALFGVVVRGLPTTPFLLVTSYCYARSSAKAYRWLTTRRWLAPYLRHVQNVQEGRGLPLSVKCVALVCGWSSLGFSALFVVERPFTKAILIGIALVQTIVMVRIKTLKTVRA